ncbi:glycosyl hydrolase family 28-related protein [Flavobacterium sp. P21]|uniref:glycosyl hydrolase family 28-related protein n=1 Tax=Flavobacterium sp. P21 TaxID=3423948 RepID=UPI003D67C68B
MRKEYPERRRISMRLYGITKSKFDEKTHFYIIYFFSMIANAQTCDVTKYGAIGDGKTINTKALQNTIDTCFKNGGGTVYVPSGVF